MPNESYMDKWLNKEMRPEEPTSLKDCNEFLLNWVRVLAYGGGVKKGALNDVEKDFEVVAKKLDMELWQDQWIIDKLKSDLTNNKKV